MRTVLDQFTRDMLITRIQSLDHRSTALWGKMNIYQMLKHCTLFEEMMFGKEKYDRVFIGRIFGQVALKKMLKDETPFKRNEPTSPSFKIKANSGDIVAEKTKWIALINGYEQLPDTVFTHWFFGKMTKDQVGYFAFKHADHHLRQFNS